MNQTETIITALVVLACIFGVFLLLRELYCWYFKINERVRLASEQLKVSKQILANLGALNEKLTNANPLKPTEDEQDKN